MTKLDKGTVRLFFECTKKSARPSCCTSYLFNDPQKRWRLKFTTVEFEFRLLRVSSNIARCFILYCYNKQTTANTKIEEAQVKRYVGRCTLLTIITLFIIFTFDGYMFTSCLLLTKFRLMYTSSFIRCIGESSLKYRILQDGS